MIHFERRKNKIMYDCHYVNDDLDKYSMEALIVDYLTGCIEFYI